MIKSPQDPFADWGSKTEAGNASVRDVWAVGCIFGEMPSGEQLFPEAKFGPSAGVQKITHVIGPLPGAILDLIQANQLRRRLIEIGNNRSIARFFEEDGLMVSDDNP